MIKKYKNEKICFIKSAFTLAEVLIVTAILGVVAVLAIPSLSKSTDVDKNIVLVKSTCGIIETALSSFINDEGTFSELSQNGKSISDIQNLLLTKIPTYIKTGKKCANNSLDSCLSAITLKYPNNANVFDGKTLKAYIEDNKGVAFELPNGAVIAITTYSDTAGTTLCKNHCFDINGLDAPNVAGIDIFCAESDDDTGTLKIPSTPVSGNFAYNLTSHVIGWIFAFDNMDYLKCAGNLNWGTKHTCN